MLYVRVKFTDELNTYYYKSVNLLLYASYVRIIVYS